MIDCYQDPSLKTLMTDGKVRDAVAELKTKLRNSFHLVLFPQDLSHIRILDCSTKCASNYRENENEAADDSVDIDYCNENRSPLT
jgi:hypothetical protein